MLSWSNLKVINIYEEQSSDEKEQLHPYPKGSLEEGGVIKMLFFNLSVRYLLSS